MASPRGPTRSDVVPSPQGIVALVLAARATLFWEAGCAEAHLLDGPEVIPAEPRLIAVYACQRSHVGRSAKTDAFPVGDIIARSFEFVSL